MDASFVYMETAEEHQHTVKVSILDPPPRGYSFERAKKGIRARLDRTPPYRWRTVHVPFDLHHPVWIEDPAFDIDRHVCRAAVPAPGGRRELCELISQIASRRLDPNRPRWELWMLEGLEGGRIAAVTKLHHSLADGVASVELLDSFFDMKPAEGPAPAAGPLPRPEPVPSPLRLLWGAVVDFLRFLAFGLPRLIRATRDARRRHKEETALNGREPTPSPFMAAQTSLNQDITGPERSFAFETVSLDAAREIHNRFDVTINDVVLATVAGALRRHFSRRDELPAEPLVAAMPKSVRTEKERRSFGNRLTASFVWLPTHLEDPVERLRAAHEYASAAKEEAERTRGARFEDWMSAYPPFVLKLFFRIAYGVWKISGKLPCNLSIASVAGPKRRLYYNMHALQSFVSVGHVLSGACLNVTVWSYADDLSFALYAFPPAVPDLWRLCQDVREAFDELLYAARGEPAGIESA